MLKMQACSKSECVAPDQSDRGNNFVQESVGAQTSSRA
jgi:hypothetical protein